MLLLLLLLILIFFYMRIVHSLLYIPILTHTTFGYSFSQSNTFIFSLDMGVWNILRNLSGLVTCVTSVDWHAHFKSPWCTHCVASVNWHIDSKHIYTCNLYRLAHVSNLGVRSVHPLMYLSRLVHTVFAYSLWRSDIYILSHFVGVLERSS